MIAVPIFNNSSFLEKIVLDDKSYTLRFDWNDRGEFYTLNVYDASDTLLIAGRKVSLFVDLLSQFKGTDFPQGMLMIIDPSTTNFSPIIQDDFIDRLYLIYFDRQEINVIA